MVKCSRVSALALACITMDWRRAVMVSCRSSVVCSLTSWESDDWIVSASRCCVALQTSPPQTLKDRLFLIVLNGPMTKWFGVGLGWLGLRSKLDYDLGVYG